MSVKTCRNSEKYLIDLSTNKLMQTPGKKQGEWRKPYTCFWLWMLSCVILIYFQRHEIQETAGVKIAVGHRIFPTELIKSLINSLKYLTVKKNIYIYIYIYKTLKIVEFIWILTHDSQHITLLGVSMIKGNVRENKNGANRKMRVD